MSSFELLDIAAPRPGEGVEIAEGVLWCRLPMPMRLDHVNIYAFDEDDGWTIIDAGIGRPETREGWERLASGALCGRPVRRVILTHHHPDHVGLVAERMAEGASLWATRVAWMQARMLTLDHHDRPTPERLRFLRRAGWSAERLDKIQREEPFNFSRVAGLLPEGFTRIREDDSIVIGGRRWTVRVGEGHAPQQATFWSEDGELALTADQILPGISPNIGVHPAEPEADPLAGWLESCRRLRAVAEKTPGRLALPGHQKPFRGIADRLSDMIAEHESALDLLEARITSDPATAVEVFEQLFGRRIADSEFGLATAEAVAHMNHLRATGRAVAVEDDFGALRFRPSP